LPFQEFLPLHVYGFVLVMARVGAMLFLMPGIGETFISAQIRIYFAIFLALLSAPFVAEHLPAQPESVAEMFSLVATEMIIGIFFGLLARIMILTLDTAGRVISMAIGLSNAQIFNPAISQQGTISGVLLSMLGIMLLFITNLHHLLIMALFDSYTLFPPGQPLPIGDMTVSVSRLFSDSFNIAIQISGPFIVVNLLFFLALGMVARLMPQMPIFFVALPIQVGLGLFIFSVVLTGMFTVFLPYYSDNITRYMLAG